MVTIKVAAEMTGLTIKSIRFYEKEGLFKPSSRSSRGFRLFSEEDIQQLHQIRLYRELKFSLKETAELLDPASCNVKAALRQQMKLIEKKKHEYERISRILENAIVMDGEFDLEDKLPALHQKERIAIVGIDLQNEFLEGGALPSNRFLNLTEPLKKLFDQAREQGVPVIYVCDNHHQGVDKELELWGDHCIEGTWGAEIIAALAPHPKDYILKKSFFNGFVQTELQCFLDRLNIDTLIIVGWRTHVCVALTAIEAFHLGYRVIIAEDGVDSTSKEEHLFGLRMLQVNYGFEMYPCNEVLVAATQEVKI